MKHPSKQAELYQKNCADLDSRRFGMQLPPERTYVNMLGVAR